MGRVTGTEDIQEDQLRLTSEPVVYVGDKRFEDCTSAEVLTALTQLLRRVSQLRKQVQQLAAELATLRALEGDR